MAITSEPKYVFTLMTFLKTGGNSTSFVSNTNFRKLWLFVYMAVCIHGLFVCMAVCMHGCLYAWLFVCMAVCMHGCLYAWLFVCMAVCMHGCLYAWLFVYMAVCIHGCLNTWNRERKITRKLVLATEFVVVYWLFVYHLLI